MSTAAKMSLADIALELRDEQLQAKVVHYRADLATNAELDAVTAQVVAELQSLKHARRGAARAGVDRTELEIELIRTLKEMLARLFPTDKLSTVLERKINAVGKRFARLFFESELADEIRGSNDEARVMRYSDQALYHALVRAQGGVLAALQALPYAEPKIQDRAKARYLEIVKELRDDFLARTTPELNVLITYLSEALSAFFTRELPPVLGELAWEVVREARLADASATAGYKIGAAAFATFRQVFERQFLKRLVPFTADEMLRRVRATSGQFRAETAMLVADPLIFSEVCGVVCDAVYDMLYNDGFLDLPPDWRAKAAS